MIKYFIGIVNKLCRKSTRAMPGEPSVAVIINNQTTNNDVLLTQFQSIQFLYSPTIKQVYIKNTSTIKNYYLSYTIFGNTARLGTLAYTSVPTATDNSAPLIIKPGQNIFFTPTTKYSSSYNVATYNAKMIWQDMTVSDGEGNYFQCDKNNQHIGTTIDENRILMSCLTLTGNK